MTSVKHVKIKKNMGISFVIASLFFFFNPDINVIDILPDFVGYILLIMGLSQFAMINDYINDAYIKFKKMIFVSGLKMVSPILIFGVFPDKEIPTGCLLFAFSFAVIELILLIPAYNDLFEGIIYLLGRHGGNIALLKNKRKPLAEKVKGFTIAFVIIKSLCAVLPEMLSLTTTDYTENFVMYLYDFIVHFRVIGFTVGLVFGLVWLVRTNKFFKEIKKDTEFVSRLNEIFEQITVDRVGVFIQRNLSRAALVLIAASLLCVDLHMPDYNIIPDAVAAIIFFVGAYMLKNYVSHYKKMAIASVGYFIFSICASVYKCLFLEEYGFFTAANYKEEAYFMFMKMSGFTVIENIAFLAVVFFLILSMRELVANHTGVEIENWENKMKKRRSFAEHQFYKRLWVVGALAVLSAICSIAYDFLLIERGRLADIMWAIDFAATGVFAGTFLFTALSILDDIKTRYMYS